MNSKLVEQWMMSNFENFINESLWIIKENVLNQKVIMELMCL
jgi:hypothetical protein